MAFSAYLYINSHSKRTFRPTQNPLLPFYSLWKSTQNQSIVKVSHWKLTSRNPSLIYSSSSFLLLYFQMLNKGSHTLLITWLLWTFSNVYFTLHGQLIRIVSKISGNKNDRLLQPKRNIYMESNQAKVHGFTASEFFYTKLPIYFIPN